MLSPTLVARMNAQIALEFYSSNLYLQMAAWCDHKGFPGCAAFLSQHASEEYQHGRKLLTYVMETGAEARIGAVDAPPAEFTGIQDVFVRTLEHEIRITGEINRLVRTAFEENDFSTFNFLQWYAAEQHEEEKLFRTITDRVRQIGADGKGLYWIDKEIGKQVKSASST